MHIGSGPVDLPGWINIDVSPYEGVAVVTDVRAGLPFLRADFIFAEHFAEHLALADGIAFFRECRRVLAPEGVLRLSTPNLDWVWLTHYKKPDEMTEEERLYGCLEINRAFHGWGHQFLYNPHVIALALRAAGFGTVVERAYGESTIGALRDLERHERHRDMPGAPSVLIVEASGFSEGAPDFENVAEPFIRDANAT